MKSLILASAAMIAAIASPAAAADYSLAGDFGASVFQYGTVGSDNTFTAFAPSNCNDIGVSGLCYRGSDKYQVEFQKSATDLLIHPGPNDRQNSIVLFTAPTTGMYTFNTTLTRGDTGDGVNVYTFNNLQGGLNLIGRVDAANPVFNFSGSQFYTAGQQVGFGVDRGGVDSTYFNDSTLLSGTITSPTGAVPESATWAMMLMGFGMIGFGLRRRKSQVSTNVQFA